MPQKPADPGTDASDRLGVPPLCAQRHGWMILKQVAPDLSVPSTDEVTYACPVCGTETKRSLKRD